MKRLRFIVSVLALSVAAAAVGRADAAAVIAKARSYLGSDQALNSVNSIHYIGTLDTTEEVSGVEKPVSYQIDIIFQKSYQQRIVLTKEKSVETTALDDYEAWHRQEDKSDPSRWRTVLFPKSKVKQMRASTWENLAFFTGLERIGGTVVDHGKAEVEGKSAYKISFLHEPGIVYVRYFDPQTGRLLLTETDQGVRIREEGEIVAGGVRFPKRIINTTSAQADGKDKERVVTINIASVTVNEKFPEDLFSVPLVPPK